MIQAAIVLAILAFGISFVTGFISYVSYQVENKNEIDIKILIQCNSDLNKSVNKLRSELEEFIQRDEALKKECEAATLKHNETMIHMATQYRKLSLANAELMHLLDPLSVPVKYVGPSKPLYPGSLSEKILRD